VRALAAAVEQDPAAEVIIDVAGSRVLCSGMDFSVEIVPAAYEALISGQWDPIAELQEGDAAVAERISALGYLPG
jgi:3-isopropylmalate/(R)-2-methylmalate dehydratase small subunit